MFSPPERVRSLLEPVLEPLIDQPMTQRLLAEVSSKRDQLLQAQEATLSALNLPTATDVATLERRLRAPAAALDRIEEQLDRIEARLQRLESALSDPDAANG